MPVFAQPLVIDDFEAGAFAVVDSSPPATSTAAEQSGLGPAVVGGVRLVDVTALAQPGAVTAMLAPADGVDDGALLSGVRHQVLFRYDGLASAPPTASGSAGALGLDLSGYSRITVLASGITGVVTARVWLFPGSGAVLTGSSVPLVEGLNSLPLSGFSAADRTDVRALDIEIQGTSPTNSLRVMEIAAVEGTLRHVGSGTCGGNSPCYAAIQAAVDAAEPGDTVRVRAGSYPELVRITGKSDLILEGDPASPPGSAVIEPADGGPAECLAGTAAVEIASSSGVTLQQLAISGYDGTGLRLRGATQANSEVQILGLRITGTGSAECGAGILVEEPNAQTLLAHNAIVGNAHDGVAFSGMPPLGTSVPQYLWSNTIVGNGRHGVVVSGFERPSLWNNLIAGNGVLPSPYNALPAYGVARELAGLLAPLANSQILLRHNLVCGNRSGELSLAPTETLDGDSAGNLSPTGSEGAAFGASPDCGDPEVLFATGAGPDTLWGTDDDDYFLTASSPAVDAGDGVPTPAIADLAALQSDYRRGGVRPADGDDDEVFDYDIGALEYGVAPTISITSPANGSTATSSQIDVTGTFMGTAPLQIEVDGVAPTLSGGSFETAATLVTGTNSFTATISNAFGSAFDSTTVTLPPLDISIQSPTDGAVTDQETAVVSGTVNDSAASLDVNGVAATVAGSGWSATVPLEPFTNTLTATASRNSDTATDESTVVRADESPPPPAESAAEVASPLDPSAAASLADSVSFLYGDANSGAIQTMPDPSVIDDARVAVARGRLLRRSGTPIGGVEVSVLGRPEFGTTHSQADGTYDLVVNGGGGLTIHYYLPGYIPAQRQINPRWRDYAIVDDLVMLPLDPVATTVDLTSPPAAVQIARGTVSSDADGTRQATALFFSGTTAKMKKREATGTITETPLSTLTVRLTEFTVGANGPQTMPASLPPTSGYTYAVEASVDEAVQAGAFSVVFTGHPVVIYLENFLDIPVGKVVPVGTYDYERATWVPDPNGRVIQIDSIDGNGQAVVSGMTLADTNELTALANLYPPGQQLWRLEMTHFSPMDGNYPWKYPDGADGPQFDGVGDYTSSACPSLIPGSVIECETQVLGEVIDLAGVPFAIHYRSSRTPGYAANRTVKIPITDDLPPEPLQRVDIQVDVAGKRSSFTFPNTVGQPEFLFTWEGKDAYERAVQGATPGTVGIGYVYQAEIGDPWESLRSFGEPAQTRMQIAARGDAIAWRDYPATFTSLDARGFGIGGWTLAPHHFYDRVSQTLHRGDGHSQNLSAIADVIQLATGVVPSNGASFRALGFAPDGSLYFLKIGSFARLHRVDRQGAVSPVTGPSTATTELGGLASATRISSNTSDVAVGRDGSVYLAEYKNWSSGSPKSGRILRIDAVDGTIDLFAGGGSSASDPCASGFDPMISEGGSALNAPLCLNWNSELATAPDGSVYFSRPNSGGGEGSIRRVRPDGKLETVVLSTGSAGPSHGRLARQLGSNAIQTFALDTEGRLCFASSHWEVAVFAVRPEDTVVERIAGGGNPPDGIGDGLSALAAKFAAIGDLAVGPDGRLYVAALLDNSSESGVVRTFIPGGVIRRLAGNGTNGTTGNGGSAIQAPLNINLLRVSIAVSPEGTVDFSENRFEPFQVRAVAPPVPHDLDEIAISSEDGREIYYFDAGGRHLRTRSARTSAKLRTFCYNGDGHLTQIREVAPASAYLAESQDCVIGSDDRVTTVEWSGSHPTAIVGPFGAHTQLGVDANGYLTSVSDPLGHAYTLASTSSGLLTSFTPPEGGEHRFTYDSLGLLTRDEDPAGGFKELTRTDIGDRIEIEIETALGRVETKALEPTGSGVLWRSFTDAAGLVTELFENPGDSSSSETPDGTQSDVVYGPDPRLGTVAPIAKDAQIKTPANLTRTRTHARTASVDAQGNLTSQTDTLTLNSRTSTVAYVGGSTRKETSTTPLTRKVIEYFDAQERVTQSELVGLEPVRFGYDARGRLTSTSQGQGTAERTTSFTYGTDGYLATVTDDLNRTTGFEYDEAGRLTSTTLPDNRQVAYTWDANGNLASLTPPGQPAHVFRYTSLDQESEYEPPAVDANDPRTVFTYDLDRDLTRIDRPDGGAVVLGYDSAGRVSSVQTSRGTTTPVYSGVSGNINSLSAPAGEGLAFTYDGRLPKRTTWSGTVAGYVEHGWDNDFRVSTQNVNGSNSVTFGYDADSLLTSAGSLSLTRHTQTGLLTNTSLGIVATSLDYNGFGEVTSDSATISGSTAYATTFTRDDLGRITQKGETIQGVATTYAYRFDTAGRLDQVKHDGIVVRSYTYDDNGNRLSVGSTAATYDEQDRILTYGSTSYAHDAAGDLTSKTNESGITGYTYDEVGNLTQVTLPNSTSISYAIDGQNRRIGKRVNGVLVKGWLYQDHLEPIAELDGSGNVVSRFVYGDKANVPAYMVQGGTTYRILSDHLGSVRLVVDTTTGTVAQRLDYDEFGNITADTNPGFQPFGFAGGLYDADTGLTRFGARDYDPQIGRWRTKDPIGFAGGDSNLYGYVLADPVNLVDPTGEVVPVLLIAAGAAVGGAVNGAVYAATTSNFTAAGFAGAVAGGAVAGAIGTVATPLAGALGLGTGVLGTAAVNAGAGVAGAAIAAGLDPCQNASAGYLASSGAFGAFGGWGAGRLFPTHGMTSFGQVGFPRTPSAFVPRSLGGNMGTNARAATHGAGVSVGVGAAGPAYVQ